MTEELQNTKIELADLETQPLERIVLDKFPKEGLGDNFTTYVDKMNRNFDRIKARLWLLYNVDVQFQKLHSTAFQFTEDEFEVTERELLNECVITTNANYKMLEDLFASTTEDIEFDLGVAVNDRVFDAANDNLKKIQDVFNGAFKDKRAKHGFNTDTGFFFNNIIIIIMNLIKVFLVWPFAVALMMIWMRGVILAQGWWETLLAIIPPYGLYLGFVDLLPWIFVFTRHSP